MASYNAIECDVIHCCSHGLARRMSFYVTELDPEGSKWSVWDFIQTPIVFSFNWFVRHPFDMGFKQIAKFFKIPNVLKCLQMNKDTENLDLFTRMANFLS